MLEEIKNIDWNNIDNGWAREIPNWFQKLLIGKADEQEIAYNRLRDIVYHQGSVFESSVVVIPYLINALSIKDIKAKYYLLRLLQYLADAHLSHLSKERAFQIYNAVKLGLSRYLLLLQESNLEIRGQVFSLLCSFNDIAGQILPPLSLILDAEKDPEVKAEMIRRFGILLGNSKLSLNEKEQYLKLLEPFLAKPYVDIRLTLRSCVAIIYVFKSLVADEVVNHLVELMENIEAFNVYGWDILDITIEICQLALSKIERERQIITLLQIFEVVSDKPDNQYWMYNIGRILFLEAFHNVYSDKLTQEQKYILQLLLRKRQIWENLVEDYPSLLERLRIPFNREDALTAIKSN